MDDNNVADGGSVTEGLKKEHGKEEEITQNSPEISADDKDAAWDEADTAGTELPGGGNETPDEGNVDDIGKAVGESYEDTEPLDPTKKEKPSEY